MAGSHAVKEPVHASAETHSRVTTPSRTDEVSYRDGYQPQSYLAPHSSLNRICTWLGMGLFLMGIPTIGALVFGLATWPTGTQSSWLAYAIMGLIGMAVCFGGGMVLIGIGRRPYHQWAKRHQTAH